MTLLSQVAFFCSDCWADCVEQQPAFTVMELPLSVFGLALALGAGAGVGVGAGAGAGGEDGCVQQPALIEMEPDPDGGPCSCTTVVAPEEGDGVFAPDDDGEALALYEMSMERGSEVEATSSKC